MARNTTTLSFFLKTTFACVLLASLIAFFTVHMLGPVSRHYTPESLVGNHPPPHDEASEGRRRRRRRNRILSSWKNKKGSSLPYRFNDYDVNNEEEDMKVTTVEEVKIRKQKEEIVTKSLALLQSQLKKLRTKKGGGRKEDTRYSNVPTKEQIKESITALEAEVETYRKAAGRDDAASVNMKRQREEKRIVKSIDVLLSKVENIDDKERKSQLRKSIGLLEVELRKVRKAGGGGGVSPKDRAEEEERPEEEPEEEHLEEEQPEEEQPEEEEQPAEDQENGEEQLAAKEKIIEPNTNVETADERSPKKEKRNSDPTKQEENDIKNKKKKPLNILLLYADDWRHDTLGVAGHPIVETPFLDKLAKHAIRFTHNCVTTAVCWISRATLMTGQYMSRHKTSHPDDPKWYDHWEQTYPALLKQHGYHTGHVGKWNFKDQHLVDSKMYDFHNFYEGAHWPEPEHFVDKKRKHITERNEDDAMQFLKERPKDKPFCLTVAFFAPHAEDAHPLQYLPQPQSMDLYNDDTVPYPKVSPEQSFQRLPDFLQDEHQEGRSRYHWRFDEPTKYQNMTKNYFRLIHEVDQSSKRLYHELKQQGLLKDTIVIFTTDNGYFLAEHGMAGKWYPHEESIRVPLIIQDPRMDKELRGTMNDDFTLNIDLAPTILSAAGIDVPDVMQGEDISQLYLSKSSSNNQNNNEEETKWRDEFYYEHPWHSCEHCIPASEALVRKEHKLMMWPKFNVEQLFDLSLDPNEEYDLIDSKDHVELVKEMKGRYLELKQMAL